MSKPEVHVDHAVQWMAFLMRCEEAVPQHDVLDVDATGSGNQIEQVPITRDR